MYQVIKMYGDFEPWWFLDGWEEDVTSRAAFDRYEDALNAFQKEWVRLSEDFPMKKSKNGTMVAFGMNQTSIGARNAMNICSGIIR